MRSPARTGGSLGRKSRSSAERDGTKRVRPEGVLKTAAKARPTAGRAGGAPPGMTTQNAAARPRFSLLQRLPDTEQIGRNPIPGLLATSTRPSKDTFVPTLNSLLNPAHQPPSTTLSPSTQPAPPCPSPSRKSIAQSRPHFKFASGQAQDADREMGGWCSLADGQIYLGDFLLKRLEQLGVNKMFVSRDEGLGAHCGRGRVNPRLA